MLLKLLLFFSSFKTTIHKINNINIIKQENINNHIEKLPYKIYMFHSIEDSKPIYKWWYNLTYPPKKMEKFVRYLKENNYTFLTFKDLDDILKNKKLAAKKWVILTFDDGYYTMYQHLLPIFKKYNAKWVFFIIVNKVWKKWYMNWNQIKKLQKYGNEIGSHTLNHPDLRYTKNLYNEIVISKKILEKNLNTNVISFCYPAWKYNQKVVNLVKKYYKFARTTHPWYFHPNIKKYKYIFPTIRVVPSSNLILISKYK